MARLIKPAAKEWPRDAGWLVPKENCTPLGYAIVTRAFKDVGIREEPPGSNRGVRIERYLREADVPEDVIAAGRGWWCAAFVGAVLRDCGVPVPAGYAACDAWIPYLEAKGAKPHPGDVILYGVRGDAQHIGIAVRSSPLDSIEGNRSFAGTTSNNGVACDYGPVIRRDILGIITPERLIASFEAQ